MTHVSEFGHTSLFLPLVPFYPEDTVYSFAHCLFCQASNEGVEGQILCWKKRKPHKQDSSLSSSCFISTHAWGGVSWTVEWENPGPL